MAIELPPLPFERTALEPHISGETIDFHYGKEARTGRKVGHATLRADSADALASSLVRVGDALGRQAQVAPVVEALKTA